MPAVNSAVDCHRPFRTALSNDAVHLWHVDLDLATPPSTSLRASLAKNERMRAACFRFTPDAERFVAARGLLRAILSRYLNTTGACLRLRQATSGKPFLVDHCHLRFNVSHTSSTMLVAIAREREVGVDIERLDHNIAIEELAEATLSMGERRVLDGLDGKPRRTAFLTFWTRKEALVKADGRGFSLGLCDVDVSDPAGHVTLRDEMMRPWSRRTRWLLQMPAVGKGHVAAVAAEGHDWHIVHRRWPGDLCGHSTESHGDG